MDTSDDPVTVGLIVAGAAIQGEQQRKQASKAAAKADERQEALQAKANQRTETAAPVEQLSETARRNRQRASAFRPRGFAPPQLGQPGLLGVVG
jgi:hypothetical protein